MLGLSPPAAASSSRQLKVATTRPAARPVARSVIAGRPAPGCSASKRRATGPTSSGSNVSLLCSARSTQLTRKVDAFGLFTGQVGYACEQRPALRQGRRRRDRRPLSQRHCDRHRRTSSTSAERHPLGRHGRRRPRIRLRPELVGCASNTTTCSWATAPTPSSTTASLASPARASRTERIRQDVDLVTVRVNYRWGGPVIAKY